MIILEDMKMPNSCLQCPMCYFTKPGFPMCNYIHSRASKDGRNKMCPLKEIGTCKDCRWLTTDEDGNYYCIQTGCFDSLDFYCTDFEKRGAENE